MANTFTHTGYLTPMSPFSHDAQKLADQMSILIIAMCYVTEHDTAIDGGAYVGRWAVAMAKHFRRVIAYEPNLVNAACMAQNLTAHSASNVTLIYKALGDRQRTVKMEVSGAHFYKRAATGDDVPMVALDDVELNDVGLIKLDLEGYDLEGLKGALKLIMRCSPVLIVEIKNQRDLIHKWCTSHGYTCVHTSGPDAVYVPNGREKNVHFKQD